MSGVKEIRFEIVIGDVRREAVFLRKEKINKLLADPGSLGEFLRAMADIHPVDDVDIESVKDAFPGRRNPRGEG